MGSTERLERVTELGIEIDGSTYEWPQLGSLSMDEARIFHKATGFPYEELWIGKPDGQQWEPRSFYMAPGCLEALAHIAYRREHENAADDDIRVIVGNLNRLQVFFSLIRDLTDGEEEAQEDDEAGPLEDATSDPAGSSPRSSDEKPTTPLSRDSSSGTPSETSSVPQVVALGTTGIGGSGMSSTSDRIRRAV